MENLVIHILDDDLFYATFFKENIEIKLSAKVELFASAEMYFDELSAIDKPDVLILDYHLSEDDKAPETFSKFRSYFSNVPVIILSASNDLQKGVDIIKSGAVDYIVKSTDAINQIVCSIMQIQETRVQQVQIEESIDSSRTNVKRIVVFVCLLVITISAFLITKGM